LTTQNTVNAKMYLCRDFFWYFSRKECNSGTGVPPIYVNVNMWSGEPVNNWMDSLQAAWPGVQVINPLSPNCKISCHWLYTCVLSLV